MAARPAVTSERFEPRWMGNRAVAALCLAVGLVSASLGKAIKSPGEQGDCAPGLSLREFLGETRGPK